MTKDIYRGVPAHHKAPAPTSGLTKHIPPTESIDGGAQSYFRSKNTSPALDFSSSVPYTHPAIEAETTNRIRIAATTSIIVKCWLDKRLGKKLLVSGILDIITLDTCELLNSYERLRVRIELAVTKDYKAHKIALRAKEKT